MIVVDTSALMAIALSEPSSNDCVRVLGAQTTVLISAGTVVEVLVVAARRGIVAEVTGLLDSIGFQVVPVTAEAARRIGAAYARWGKGLHPAGLNFGDCFAYDVAIEHGCPLLFVGDDFARTDVTAAL